MKRRALKLTGDIAWTVGGQLEIVGVRLCNLAHTIDRKVEMR